MAQPSSLLQFMESYGLAQFFLKHYWNFGYQELLICKTMSALPFELMLSLKSLCDVIDCIADESSTGLKDIMNTLRAGMEDVNFRPSYCCRPSYCSVRSYIQSGETNEWEEEVQYGLIKMIFEPSSQNREAVFVNSKAARFWNLSKKKILKTISKNDLVIPSTTLDWISSFVIYISTYFTDTAAQFLRFYVGGKASLICMTTFKTRDSVGRISEVCETACKTQNFFAKH